MKSRIVAKLNFLAKGKYELVDDEIVLVDGADLIKDGVAIIPVEVSVLGSGCFGDCTSLVEVKVLGVVKYICRYAFANCTNLVKINLPKGLISIGDNSFSECYKLKDISLPEGLRELGNYCFSSCKKLDVNLPSTLEKLGLFCFKHCALSQITIPVKVSKIPYGCFYDCDNLVDVDIKGKVSIDSFSFRRCYSLKRVGKAGTVKSICDDSMIDCYSLTYVGLSNVFSRLVCNTKCFLTKGDV